MNHENVFVLSLDELRNVRAVTFCGIMAALAIVLNYVASINVGDYIRIGFSGIPNQAVAYLFGPAIGSIFGGMLDVIKYFLKPTGAFFPGFTLSAVLGGIIYGIFLYRKKVTIARVFFAQLAVKAFVNVCLNTFWLNILYKSAIVAILPERIISNLIMLPIDTFICFVVLRLVEKTVKPSFDRMRGERNRK